MIIISLLINLVYSYESLSQISTQALSNYDDFKFVHYTNNLYETENGTLWFIMFHGGYSSDKQIKAFYSNDTGETWNDCEGVSNAEILALSDWKGISDSDNGLFYDGEYFTFMSKGAGLSYDDLCYRRGKFLDNGSIDWSAAIQYGNTWDGGYATVTVDSSGYAYMTAYNSDSDYIVLTKNGNNDGTWSEAWRMNLTEINPSAIFIPKSIIDSNDNIYVFYSDTDTGQNVLNYIIVNDNTIIKESTLLLSDLSFYWSYDVLIDNNDNLYFVYLSNDSNYIKAINYNGTWSEEQIIVSAQSNSYPSVTYDKKAEKIIYSWLESEVYNVEYDIILNTFGNITQYSETLTDLNSNDLFSTYEKIEFNDYGYVLDLMVSADHNPHYIQIDLDESRTPSEIEIPSEPIDYNMLFTITGFVTVAIVLLIMMYVKFKGELL